MDYTKKYTKSTKVHELWLFKDRKAIRDQFVTSCGEGHLDIIQWLTTTFNLTAEDARAKNNDALRGSRTRWLTVGFFCCRR